MKFRSSEFQMKTTGAWRNVLKIHVLKYTTDDVFGLNEELPITSLLKPRYWMH